MGKKWFNSSVEVMLWARQSFQDGRASRELGLAITKNSYLDWVTAETRRPDLPAIL
jgi:hypothetical protein